MRIALPIAAWSAPRFAYKRRVKCSVNTVGAMPLIALNLLFQNSPIKWALPTGNGNTFSASVLQENSYGKCHSP